MNRRERAIELLELISNGRKQLHEWEMELDRLLPGGRARFAGKRPKATTSAKPSRPVATGKSLGRETTTNGRGDLTGSLLGALKSVPPEFTSRELITAAGVPNEKVNSAFAAISRLAAKGDAFVKSTTTPGKFRRVQKQ